MNEKYDKLMTGIKNRFESFKEHNVLTAYKRHKESSKLLKTYPQYAEIDFSDIERASKLSQIAFEKEIRSQIDTSSHRHIVSNYIANKNEYYSQLKKTAAIGTTVLFLSGVAALAVKDANDDTDIKIHTNYDNNTGLSDAVVTFSDTPETILGMPVGYTDSIDNVDVELYNNSGVLIENPKLSDIISTDNNGNSSIIINDLAPGNYTVKIQAIDSENDVVEYTKELNITDEDTDKDGLFDHEEWNIWKTDPTNPDTDGDGYSDKEEIDYGTNPLDPKNHYTPIVIDPKKDTSGIMTYWDNSKNLYSFNDIGKIVDKIIEKSESPITTPMDTYEVPYGDDGTLVIPTGYTPQVIHNDDTGFIVGLTPTDSVDSDSDATVLDLIDNKISLNDAVSSIFDSMNQKAHILEDSHNEIIPGMISMNNDGSSLVFSNTLGDDDETIYVSSARDTDPSEYTSNAWKNLENLEKKLHQMGLVTYGSSGGSVTGGTPGSGGGEGEGGGSGE
ncbi:hypothetical protein GQ473_04485 [archaeon]|nr:hypothetical protein [archaeon]